MAVNIQIVNLENPGHFWAREIPGPGMSKRTSEFQQLDNKIQSYCQSEDHLNIHVQNPKKGQKLLVWKRTDHEAKKHWYRGVVKNVLCTRTGSRVSCYLIDTAETVLVHSSELRVSPDEFMTVPAQIWEYKLHGIKPVSMFLSFEEGADIRPCSTWDTAAEEYFNQLIRDKPAEAVPNHTSPDGTNHVVLLVRDKGERINVNRKLVEMKYAIFSDDRDTTTNNPVMVQADLVSPPEPSRASPSRNLHLPSQPAVNVENVRSPSKGRGVPTSQQRSSTQRETERKAEKLLKLLKMRSSQDGNWVQEAGAASNASVSSSTASSLSENTMDASFHQSSLSLSSPGDETRVQSEFRSSSSSSPGNQKRIQFQLHQMLGIIPSKERSMADSGKGDDRERVERERVSPLATSSFREELSGSCGGKPFESDSSRFAQGGSSKMEDITRSVQNKSPLPSLIQGMLNSYNPHRPENTTMTSIETNFGTVSPSTGRNSSYLYSETSGRESINIRSTPPSGKSMGLLKTSPQYDNWPSPQSTTPKSVSWSDSESGNESKPFSRVLNKRSGQRDKFADYKDTSGNANRSPLPNENMRYNLQSAQPKSAFGEEHKHLSDNKNNSPSKERNIAGSKRRSLDAMLQDLEDSSLEPISPTFHSNDGQIDPTNMNMTDIPSIATSSSFLSLRQKSSASPEVNTRMDVTSNQNGRSVSKKVSPRLARLESLLTQMEEEECEVDANVFSERMEAVAGGATADISPQRMSFTTAREKPQEEPMSSKSFNKNAAMKKTSPQENVKEYNREPIRERTNSDARRSSESSMQSGDDQTSKFEVVKLPVKSSNLSSLGNRKSISHGRGSPFFSETSSDDDLHMQPRTPFLMSAKNIQQSLIKQVLSTNKERNKDIPEAELHKILIHGECPPSLIASVNVQAFPDPIKQTLQNQGILAPTLIQSASWPAVLRGREMVGIALDSQGRNLAYLLPLLTHLMTPSMYKNLPPGNGPLVLIVLPTWKKALEVYRQCVGYMEGLQKDLIAILLFGGGSEKEQEVQLLNGCSIVIGTLPCVVRMVKSNHVNLNRLFHLVFDDADTMFEEFPNEVKDLWGEYANILQYSPKRSNMRQLLVFSPTWTPTIGAFLRTCMINPMVVVTSCLEMAVYSRVKQVIVPLATHRRVNVLVDCLSAGLSDSAKVMVFTKTKEDARQLNTILKSASIYTLLAAGEMHTHQIEQVVKEWRADHRSDSTPVLVISDDCTESLGIRDASCIIHYDMPRSNKIFGHRLACMKDHFVSQIEKKQSSDCVSFLYLNPDFHHRLPNLRAIFKRAGQEVPAELPGGHRAVEIRDQGRRSTKPLCHNLKSVGACRQVSSCPARHILLPEEDQPGANCRYIKLPQSGQVKIKIMFVKHATCFFARILQYQPAGRAKTVPIRTIGGNPQLNIDLSFWYADQNRHQFLSQPVFGELAAIFDEKKTVHRLLPVDWDKGSGRDGQIRVRFVDEGRVVDVPHHKLMVLPDHFKKIPYQAVEVYACYVKPIDKDTHWTTRADSFVYDAIRGQELDGKVLLSIGNTMWLDPLVNRVKAEGIESFIYVLNVQKDLIQEGYGEHNPKHIDKLKALCDGKINLETNREEQISANAVENTESYESEGESIPEAERSPFIVDSFSVEDPTLAYLSAVSSPHCFYLQRVDREDELEELLKMINCDEDDVWPTSDADWKEGDICLSKFSLDERWYRARIQNVMENGQLDIFFVDHGDIVIVPRCDVRPIEPRFLKMPFAAVQCALPHVQQLNGADWTTIEEDALWEMCHEGVIKKVLSAQVISHASCKERGVDHCVEVFNTVDGKKVALSHMLIQAGLVKGDISNLAKVIFPGLEAEESSEGADIVQAIIDIIRKIYASQNFREQNALIEDNAFLIKKYLEKEDERGFKDPIHREVIVMALCRILNHKEKLSCDSQLQVVECLLSLTYRNGGAGKVVSNEGLTSLLCDMLSKIMDPDMLSKLLWLLSIFPENNFGSIEGVRMQLFNIFLLGLNAEIQSCTLKLIKKISLMEYALDEFPIVQCVTAVCNVLWEGCDEEVLKSAVELLLSLYPVKAAYDAMENEELADCLECIMISSTFSEQTSLVVSELFQQLEGAYPYDTDITPACVRPLTTNDTSIQSDEAEAVKEIEEREVNQGVLSTREDKFQGGLGSNRGEIDEEPPPLEDEDGTVSKHPVVQWAQRNNSVTLSVKLRGVTEFDFNVTSLSVTFSCFINVVNYEFHLELFKRVDPTHYTKTALGGEVLIKLYKESMGIRWPRLTRNKKKLTFLSVDFDRWCDSSDESADDEVSDGSSQHKKVCRLTKDERRKAIVPEMDVSSSESSSDDSDNNWDKSMDIDFDIPPDDS